MSDEESEKLGRPRDRVTPQRVLLVDDHDDQRMLLAELLDAHGYDVHAAPDGAAALAALASFSPEAALIDIGLPGMNGYELAAALRETPDGPRMRLIALSGFANNGRGEASAFDAHLLKPTTIRDILSVLAVRDAG